MSRPIRLRGGRTLLAAALVAALAGCSAEPTPQPTPSPPSPTERGPVALAVPDVNAGAWMKAAASWNRSHPNEPLTIRVLSADPTIRHDQLVQDAQAKSGENTIVALDSAWIAEFGTNGWVKPLDAAEFPTETMLPGPVAAATANQRVFGYPVTADASVLYYRKDLLASVGAKVPKTWIELAAVCASLSTRPDRPAGCYGTGLRASDSLTGNVAEAVRAAGGALLDASGQPTLDTTQAAVGVDRLVSAVKSETISPSALSWDDSDAVRAFLDGKLVFVRGSMVTARLAETSDGSSSVAGRVGVAALVSPSGTAVPNAGGLQLSLSSFGRNDATAADVIRWLSSDPGQRELLVSGGFAPVQAGLYHDAALVKQVPDLTVFGAAIASSRSIPATAHYAELSRMVAESMAPVVAGKEQAVTALPTLQSRLADLLK